MSNDNISTSLWLDAGRALASLPSPMDKAEVRLFAAAAVDAAATIPPRLDRVATLARILPVTLEPRGASDSDVELVARAVVHATDSANTLTEARSLLGSVWAGVVMGIGGRLDLEKRIAAHGFTVRYVDYCEDSRTPGFLGQIRGVVDHERREVKIGRKANPTAAAMIDILEHELRHLDEPEWDCGNRDVFGRGGTEHA